jgi:hypothetical protein
MADYSNRSEDLPHLRGRAACRFATVAASSASAFSTLFKNTESPDPAALCAVLLPGIARIENQVDNVSGQLLRFLGQPLTSAWRIEHEHARVQ